MKAPTTVETQRLLLRAPKGSDAQEMFERYAGDAEVTRFLSWPRHVSVTDTHAFLELSAAEWEQWPAGPYLIIARSDGTLLGSTGLAFETTTRSATGYVLAKDSWGQGYATESLRAVVDIASKTGVERLYALCHPEHRASQHVLEKCGFEFEGTWRRYCEFPNLHPGELEDVLCYATSFSRCKHDRD